LSQILFFLIIVAENDTVIFAEDVVALDSVAVGFDNSADVAHGVVLGAADDVVQDVGDDAEQGAELDAGYDAEDYDSADCVELAAVVHTAVDRVGSAADTAEDCTAADYIAPV
jgi:hypothetical protein